MRIYADLISNVASEHLEHTPSLPPVSPVSPRSPPPATVSLPPVSDTLSWPALAPRFPPPAPLSLPPVSPWSSPLATLSLPPVSPVSPVSLRSSPPVTPSLPPVSLASPRSSPPAKRIKPRQAVTDPVPLPRPPPLEWTLVGRESKVRHEPSFSADLLNRYMLLRLCGYCPHRRSSWSPWCAPKRLIKSSSPNSKRFVHFFCGISRLYSMINLLLFRFYYPLKMEAVVFSIPFSPVMFSRAMLKKMDKVAPSGSVECTAFPAGKKVRLHR